MTFNLSKNKKRIIGNVRERVFENGGKCVNECINKLICKECKEIGQKYKIKLQSDRK